MTHFLSKDPRDMTLEELDAIPVVNAIIGKAKYWYEDGHGTPWRIGQNGDLLVKAYRRGEAPPAGVPKLSAPSKRP